MGEAADVLSETIHRKCHLMTFLVAAFKELSQLVFCTVCRPFSWIEGWKSKGMAIFSGRSHEQATQLNRLDSYSVECIS